MALQGEGDPRWVVRQREDGRNVNGWHWEDKDVTSWAEKRLKSLIVSTTCYSDTPAPGVHVVSLDSVDGDATLYNRKGVLKVLYDLKLVGKWSSRHEDENQCTSGEFRVELFDDDPEVTSSIDSKSKASESQFRSAFNSSVAPIIVKHCQTFIKELYKGADQFVDGMSIQTNAVKHQPTKTVSRTEISSSKPAAESKDSAKKTSKQKPKSGGSKITIEESFICNSEDWLMVFLDPPRLSAITRSPAIVEPREGGKWEIMNGAASGTIVSITNKQNLTMNWKLRSWGEDAGEGVVTVNVFEPDKGRTKAAIHITGVPKGSESETEGFWRIQILQAMRVLFGWGDASKFASM